MENNSLRSNLDFDGNFDSGVVTSAFPLYGKCCNDVTNTLVTSMTLNDVTDVITLSNLRREKLDSYKTKQSFRVSIGRSSWKPYETYDQRYNLREILYNEIVIEFDSKKKWEEMSDQEKLEFKELVLRAVSQTGINLYNAGYTFELWDHGGKSPHLHIHDLDISKVPKEKRSLFKKLFIRKYVPTEYHNLVDESLTGIHLVAIEWANHWKGCWGVKRLKGVYTPQVVIQETKLVEVKPDRELKEYLESKGIEFHSMSELG